MVRSQAEFAERAGKRLRVVAVLFVVAAVAVTIRLVTLQGVEAEHYDQLAADQQVRAVEIPAPRGRILDRRGNPLAVSVETASVFANPREMQAAGETARAATLLSGILGVDAATLDQRFAKDLGFVWVARKISDDQENSVRNLTLPGVYFVDEPDRVYPSGALGASIVGFTDIDNKGLAGLEAAYDETLTGEPGKILSEKDPAGRAIPAGQYEHVAAQAGSELTLTIESAIQHEAETALADAMEQFNAKRGVVAVLDPANGDVLAFANMPTYDPNNPGAADADARAPWGVGNVFEPGSTSKIVTISAALEAGVVTPGTVQTVPDTITIYDKTFRDSSEHATAAWSTRDIIAKSSNVGTIMTARLLGEDKLDEYMQRFGYGRKTGIELPAESSGIVRDRADWSGTDLGALAIGHSVAVTPMQMLRAFGAIANDGEMHEPRIVKSITESGNEQAAPRPEPTRVISAETAEMMQDMLRGVVSEGGTATRAAIDGYDVAGKTGTARKLLENGRGYDASRHIGSFIGFAPATDPAAVIAVVLDEPKPAYGGLSAAPTFARVMEFVLRHLRVPPSEQAIR